MRSLVLVLGLVAACRLEGDPYFATCDSNSYCEGNLVRMCTADCPEEALERCELVYSTAADCAQVTANTGIEKVCGELMSNSVYAACVDKDRRPCTWNVDLGMRCSDVDPSYAQACQNTPTGGFWQTTPHCTNGKTCLTNRYDSVVCKAPNAPTCAGYTDPICRDANTVEFCAGNPTDGFFLITNDCPMGCTTMPTGDPSCR